MSLRTWTLTFAILAAAALVAAPPAAALDCGLTVNISGPTYQCSAGNVTLTANISYDPMCTLISCTYQWSYRWCECSTAPNNCPSSYTSIPDTDNSVTKYLYSFDKYLDFLVVAECQFSCSGTWTETDSDTHRVYGPKSFFCDGCSLGGGDPL